MLRETLPALERLATAFAAKGREFDSIVKSGRTHLQDATPIRLGQEFAAYAHHAAARRRAAAPCQRVALRTEHRRHRRRHRPQRRAGLHRGRGAPSERR